MWLLSLDRLKTDGLDVIGMAEGGTKGALGEDGFVVSESTFSSVSSGGRASFIIALDNSERVGFSAKLSMTFNNGRCGETTDSSTCSFLLLPARSGFPHVDM